jgi:RimJ/RimL family protein N-acetyltransferase
LDLGYALIQRRWRQGFMTEAAGRVVTWALAQPDVFRVWVTCDIENLASLRVLERVGMEREGVRDVPRDAFCDSIVKAG